MLLLDIDGVIRDVGGSYRRALAETVHHYSGWRPDPASIDALKGEGRWNNDWDASLELLRRHRLKRASETDPDQAGTTALDLPAYDALVEVFSGFYFGGDPEGDPAAWSGFIGDEPLLVEPEFFKALSAAGVAWGFVSGAEPPSARFVLEHRLGLCAPPLIAMGDAPDKPDPTGLLQLAARLLEHRGVSALGSEAPPIVYLGDTVADVQTVLNARSACPQQRFLALAVAPPHLHQRHSAAARSRYEQQLQQAGADTVLEHTTTALPWLQDALP